jgi:hypothetical protein
MKRVDFDLDDLTNAALKRLVKQLLVADDKEERKIIDRLGKKSGGDKPDRNDLADLDEEMHGKPNTPMVEDDDISSDDDLPDIPKKGRKRG